MAIENTTNTAADAASITASQIIDSVDRIMKEFGHPPPRAPGLFDVGLGPLGLDLIVPPPPRPKMTLSKNVMVRDEFRAEMDAWLIEFFGYEDDIFKDKVYIMDNRYLITRHLPSVVMAMNVCS